MPQAPTRQDAIRILASMIADVPVAMLTTTGMGRLRSRPMVTPRVPFDGTLWFITARAAGKTGEIRDRQTVHVTFVAPSDDRYVWASGAASLVEDRARLKSLWHQGYLPWLPGGSDDPELSLIAVRVDEAEYWDGAAGRMVSLAGLAEPGQSFRDMAPDMGI